MPYLHSSAKKFLPCSWDPKLLRINPVDAWHLKKTPLFTKANPRYAMVFKEAGLNLSEIGVLPDSLPAELYIPAALRELAIQEIQMGLIDGLLETALAEDDLLTLKTAMIALVEETFREPKVELLAGFNDLVKRTVVEFAERPRSVKTFLMVVSGGYTLAQHSINVMTLVLAYCLRAQMPSDQMVRLCVGGLLHDVGKTSLPANIRDWTRPLNEVEFSLFKHHPLLGVKLLAQGDFSPSVLEATEQHHERLDGSGYPQGLREISLAGQLVGLADCYDALTTEPGLHRKAMEPVECLRLLKKELDQGKFQREMFEVFAYSLAE